MPVTHQQIADRMGISRPLVTQALTRAHRVRVSPETRQEILRVAQEMGYQPRNVTTHNIGFVVPAGELGLDVTTTFFMAASRLLRERGFRLMLFAFEADEEESARQLLNQKTVDGVILGEWHDSRLYRTISEAVPCLLIADSPDAWAVEDQVSMDTAETAARAAVYLVRHGHERIALLRGVNTTHGGMIDRVADGLLRGFQSSGLPKENVNFIQAEKVEGSDAVEQALLRALSLSHPPTAIVTATPGGATSVLNRLQKNGYQVPEDVSVLSIMDSERLSMLCPAITATTALGSDVVQIAVESMVKRIHEPDAPQQQVFVPGEIIERASVRFVS